MFKPALKLVVRLLPFTAAIVASVAIGASAQAPEMVAFQGTTRPGQSMVALWSVPSIQATAAASTMIDVPSLAQTETINLLATAYPVEALDTALTAPAPKAISPTYVRKPFELPRPDRWTSLLATLALGAFFFLRRIV